MSNVNWIVPLHLRNLKQQRNRFDIFILNITQSNECYLPHLKSSKHYYLFSSLFIYLFSLFVSIPNIRSTSLFWFRVRWNEVTKKKNEKEINVLILLQWLFKCLIVNVLIKCTCCLVVKRNERERKNKCFSITNSNYKLQSRKRKK